MPERLLSKVISKTICGVTYSHVWEENMFILLVNMLAQEVIFGSNHEINEKKSRTRKKRK
jgi:hypothetical protein